MPSEGIESSRRMRSHLETAAELKRQRRLGRVTPAWRTRPTPGPKTQRQPVSGIGSPVTTYPQCGDRQAHYFSGGPIVTLRVPTPPPSHSFLPSAPVEDQP